MRGDAPRRATTVLMRCSKAPAAKILRVNAILVACLAAASCAPQAPAVAAPASSGAGGASPPALAGTSSAAPAPAASSPPIAPSSPDEVVAAHRSGLDACYT